MRYDEAALDVALGTRGATSRPSARSHEPCRVATPPPYACSRHSPHGRRRPGATSSTAVLTDVAHGTCSVLEHAFLTRVERPHGAAARRAQLRAGTATGIVYRDVAYGERAVELDGRLWHDTAEQRDRDFERDLDAAVEGQDTVRLTWGQVVGRPCSTAAKVVSAPRAGRLAAGPAVRQRAARVT